MAFVGKRNWNHPKCSSWNGKGFPLANLVRIYCGDVEFRFNYLVLFFPSFAGLEREWIWASIPCLYAIPEESRQTFKAIQLSSNLFGIMF